MGDEYGVGTVPEPIAGVTGAGSATPTPDKDLPAYKYAKALCETARSAAGEKVKTFQSNWDFLRGKNHWSIPGNQVAKQLTDNSFQGVVNWVWSVIKTKCSMITGAPSDVFCDPLDDESTYFERHLIKSSLEDDLARLNFKDVKRDAYISGSVTGIGISMIGCKPDPLTGLKATYLVPIKSDEFFRDPSADSLRSPECRFVVWEPTLDMSTIREMWPSQAHKVKPEVRQVTGGFTYKPDRTDDNLIYGSAGEFVVDNQNVLRARKARVSFVWIKDESLIEDLEEVLIKDATTAAQCVSCGYSFDEDTVDPADPCPVCGGDMELTQVPARYGQQKKIRKAYPYGRLIVYSGQALLYDGENPYEIETVFPFAVYQHDRVPGDFYGENDVSLLRSLQEEQNRTVGQLIDYVRLGVNGPVCYPVSYKAISDMGNGPNTRLPGPSVLPWKPFILRPEGFDTNAWGALFSALNHHFEVVSGLSQSLASSDSAPISATEAEINNARLSARMKSHANEFSTYCSEVASLDLQVQRQIAAFNAQVLEEAGADPIQRRVSVTMPDSTVKAIEIDMLNLPRVNVRVVINTEISVKDRLQGQNLMAFTTPGPSGQSGMDSPYADITLGKLGFSDAEIKEFMERRGLQQEIGPPGSPAPAPGMEGTAPPPPEEGGFNDAL